MAYMHCVKYLYREEKCDEIEGAGRKVDGEKDEEREKHKNKKTMRMRNMRRKRKVKK